MSPDMLLVDTTWYEVVLITITSIIGMYGVTFGLSGFSPSESGKARGAAWIQRLIAIAGGLLLIYPGIVTDIIGVVLVGGALLWRKAAAGKTAEA